MQSFPHLLQSSSFCLPPPASSSSTRQRFFSISSSLHLEFFFFLPSSLSFSPSSSLLVDTNAVVKEETRRLWKEKKREDQGRRRRGRTDREERREDETEAEEEEKTRDTDGNRIEKKRRKKTTLMRSLLLLFVSLHRTSFEWTRDLLSHRGFMSVLSFCLLSCLLWFLKTQSPRRKYRCNLYPLSLYVFCVFRNLSFDSSVIIYYSIPVPSWTFSFFSLLTYSMSWFFLSLDLQNFPSSGYLSSLRLFCWLFLEETENKYLRKRL